MSIAEYLQHGNEAGSSTKHCSRCTKHGCTHVILLYQLARELFFIGRTNDPRLAEIDRADWQQRAADPAKTAEPHHHRSFLLHGGVVVQHVVDQSAVRHHHRFAHTGAAGGTGQQRYLIQVADRRTTEVIDRRVILSLDDLREAPVSRCVAECYQFDGQVLFLGRLRHGLRHLGVHEDHPRLCQTNEVAAIL